MTTTFRIDDRLKNDCDAILDSIGLNMSCAITIFLKELSRRRAMPFELRADTPEGYYYELPKEGADRISKRLTELSEKCSENDWDGNGAKALDVNAFEAAGHFASKLPRDLSWADVDVDADGDVCFEWYKEKERQCSLTFTGDPRVYCLVKDRERKMTATFVDPSHLKLIAMIREVFNG